MFVKAKLTTYEGLLKNCWPHHVLKTLQRIRVTDFKQPLYIEQLRERIFKITIKRLCFLQLTHDCIVELFDRPLP